MTIVSIPLNPVPSQTLNITLTNQACQINVYGKQFYVPQDPVGGIASEPPVYTQINPIFLDLYVNDAPVILGALGRTLVRLVRDAYLGFIGDLFFYDVLGVYPKLPQDPLIYGLGSRWLLMYDSSLS
jgi:hypothetical protein